MVSGLTACIKLKRWKIKMIFALKLAAAAFTLPIKVNIPIIVGFLTIWSSTNVMLN